MYTTIAKLPYALIIIATLMMGSDAQAQSSCSPYLSVPCYKDFYYPGIYQDDIAYACAEQIGYYQRSLIELERAKKNLYAEPRMFRNELRLFERRLKQLRYALGRYKARRDALMLRSNSASSALLSLTSGQGYLYSNSKLIAVTQTRLNRNVITYQTTIDRLNILIANIESEIVLLTANRDTYVTNRALTVDTLKMRVDNQLRQYYNARAVTQECISIVVTSAYPE